MTREKVIKTLNSNGITNDNVLDWAHLVNHYIFTLKGVDISVEKIITSFNIHILDIGNKLSPMFEWYIEEYKLNKLTNKTGELITWV